MENKPMCSQMVAQIMQDREVRGAAYPLFFAMGWMAAKGETTAEAHPFEFAKQAHLDDRTYRHALKILKDLGRIIDLNPKARTKKIFLLKPQAATIAVYTATIAAGVEGEAGFVAATIAAYTATIAAKPLLKDNKQILLNTPVSPQNNTIEKKESLITPKSPQSLDRTSPDEPATAATEIPEDITQTLFTDDQLPSSGEETLNLWFSEFWKHYPKKVAKPQCRAIYGRIVAPCGLPVMAMHKTLMMGLSRWLDSSQWSEKSGKFICNPQTWLNQARWEHTPASSNIYRTDRNKIPDSYKQEDSTTDELGW